jgi:hypothetical protein
MARKPVTDLSAWPSLTLEGNLIAPAMVAKVAAPKDDEETRQSYRIRKGLSIRDEISTAFRVGQSHFDAFRKHEKPSADATRRFMREFLAETLGFDDLTPHEGAVSLLAGGRVPIVVTPPDEEKLDRKSATLSTDRSRSAAFALQDYVNEQDDALWGLATNGTVLRLMRDNASLTRPAYIEADLSQIFTNEDAASFSILWLLFHRTRFGNEGAPATDCDLERRRDAGAKEGEASRDRLAGQVQLALKLLGSGFLEANPELSKRIQSGDVPLTGWFNELLRLVYRLIFLMVAEDRNLLHPSKAPAAARKLYAEGYSLSTLRALCTRGATWDRHHDRYEGMKILFRSLTNGEDALALPALGGLFAADQLPHLGTARLRNRAFMEALYRLSWLTDEKKTGMVPVNWRAMETEELGSVYESLLELQPQLGEDGRSLAFASDAAEQRGNQRKTTGSYYTPDSLVQELLDTTLDPVLNRIEAESEDPAKALLQLTVIDPACGSGHFLLAAARRIATRLARIRADGTPSTEDFRHALRDVARCCIHGVDRNPMSVELTKVALWIETVDPGLPLGFLDAQIRCGDALLGIDRFEQMENGIPDAAFKPLAGDEPSLCKDLTKINKAGKTDLERHRAGESAPFAPNTKEADVFGELAALNSMPEDSLGQIEVKSRAYRQFLEHSRDSRLARAADCYLAAFLTPKNIPESQPFSDTAFSTTRTLLGEIASAVPPHEREAHEQTVAAARETCRQSFVLHWPLAFPHVFARGGFDCILGNPPWERIKLQEEEFFATRAPAIASAKNKSVRGKKIAALAGSESLSDRQLYQEFIDARRLAEAVSVYAHLKVDEGARFPLTGVGDVNTYALFAEAITRMTAPNGRAGFIVPTGIATDDSTKAFFGSIATSGRLASLFDFENSAPLFAGVHRSFKFCLLTLGTVTESSFAFFLTATEQLHDAPRRFHLTREDFLIINPNTRTCPVFRSRADAELTRAIYRRVPVLIRDKSESMQTQNPWGIHFATMFHMANDSGLFQSRTSEDFLPLYEAKMIHQFDHRWAGYNSNSDNEDDSAGGLTLAQKQDPAVTAQPRYWVARELVNRRLLNNSHPLYPLFLARLDQRRNELAKWFRFWLWGHALKAGSAEDANFLRKEIDDTRVVSHGVGELALNFIPEQHLAQRMAEQFPLTPAEQTALWQQVRIDDGLMSKNPRTFGPKDSDELSTVWLDFAETILMPRDRHWLMGWRDITNATNERTVIASVLPRVGVNHKTILINLPHSCPGFQAATFLGCINSLVFDYVARQKVGGTSLSNFISKQLPILPPSAYTDADLAFIVPRVLELTYTAHDLRPWAEDVVNSWNRTHSGQPMTDPVLPFRFDPDRRAELRADLDARYAHLYGLTRDELRYILDPADTHGTDYPTETFRVLKNNDNRHHGEYRTRRLVLEAWDCMEAEGEFTSLEL